MKFKDYYDVLGIERTVTSAEIKQAYRKLAHKYHPDVSKDPLAEAKFKDIAEAYQTLKNPEKRAAYDKLGSHQSGEDFEPPREWREQFNDTESPFANVDLADILAAFTAARQAGEHARRHPPRQGQDYEVKASITLEQIYSGAEIDVGVNLPEYDQHGLLHRVPRTYRVRVPKNLTWTPRGTTLRRHFADGESGKAWRLPDQMPYSGSTPSATRKRDTML